MKSCSARASPGSCLEHGRARHTRVALVTTWLQRLARDVRTLPLTPAIGAAAVALPSSFPGDPADRLIYATAIEHGCRLVTKDRRLLEHPHPRQIAVW